VKKNWSLITAFIVLIIALGVSFPKISQALAEQSGSSPESGSNSRLTTLYNALVTAGYGSTVSGTWGDWGTMWNRIYSAATAAVNDFAVNPEKNGTGTGTGNCTTTFGLNCYTKALGGVDDYNNNQTIPTDTYKKTWTACNLGNSYCSTNRAVAEKQDPNTSLVWSPRIYDGTTTSDWFWANNCKYPNGLPNDSDGDNLCDSGDNGQPSCICIKHTGGTGDAKTGCEAYDDGSWRLPYQKELMQSYIDGSYSNLTNATGGYWSATTGSYSTQNAWLTFQTSGYTGTGLKVTTTYSVRCVR